MYCAGTCYVRCIKYCLGPKLEGIILFFAKMNSTSYILSLTFFACLGQLNPWHFFNSILFPMHAHFLFVGTRTSVVNGYSRHFEELPSPTPGVGAGDCRKLCAAHVQPYAFYLFIVCIKPVVLRIHQTPRTPSICVIFEHRGQRGHIPKTTFDIWIANQIYQPGLHCMFTGSVLLIFMLKLKRIDNLNLPRFSLVPNYLNTDKYRK